MKNYAKTKNRNLEKTKIAFFDFDGTLSKGYISLDFLDWLFKRNAYPSDLYRRQMEMVKNYQNGRISYEDWCDEWGVLWAKGLAGRKVLEIKNLAEEFFKKFKKNIYSSSYRLIKILEKRGYRSLLLGTGACEVVDLAAKELGIDEVHATKILVRRGVYSDKLVTDFHKPRGKKKFVEDLIQSGKYDMTSSIAFGDSPHDIGMLEKVKFPVVLNPLKKMLALAKKNGWAVLNYHNVLGGIIKILRDENL